LKTAPVEKHYTELHGDGTDLHREKLIVLPELAPKSPKGDCAREFSHSGVRGGSGSNRLTVFSSSLKKIKAVTLNHRVDEKEAKKIKYL
jgi:hypothetical protein